MKIFFSAASTLKQLKADNSLNWKCTRNVERDIISCSEDISSVGAKYSLMCLMFRHLLDVLFETCFLSYGRIESPPEMFGEYFDAARRLGNSAGSASEVMLAGKANARLAKC